MNSEIFRHLYQRVIGHQENQQKHPQIASLEQVLKNQQEGIASHRRGNLIPKNPEKLNGQPAFIEPVSQYDRLFETGGVGKYLLNLDGSTIGVLFFGDLEDDLVMCVAEGCTGTSVIKSYPGVPTLSEAISCFSESRAINSES